MKSRKYDPVNHPSHYISKTGLEVIDVIEAFTDDLKGVEATDTANILKYACRWKCKNGVEDLKKLVWYANHLIQHLDKENVKSKISYQSDYNNDTSKRPKIKYRIPFDSYETREDAEEVIDRMREWVDLYGSVRVADLDDIIVKWCTKHTANDYGWTDISGAEVVRIFDGKYAIKMPRPMLII